jgi:asparagine synthase (glutamine-hydrolysing)
MCGLVAVVDSKRSIDEAELSQAIQTLHHRGPDDQGQWIDVTNQYGLAHARLGLRDLAMGQQPLVRQDLGLAVVVNGEFYGYAALRQMLLQKGYDFQTRSDSECLIYLYQEFGLGCFEYLRGEFAFVLVDLNQNRCLAARDRFGIKPLVYTEHQGKLLLASESKSLFKLGVPANWDERAFLFAAAMQYQLADATFFDKIKQVKPGHYLIYQNKTLSEKCYWDFDYPEMDSQEELSEKEAIETCRHQLINAVETRLESDVPLGFHLSGGIDSSAVVGIAHQALGYQGPCFTVSFPHQSLYDEFDLAKETAQLNHTSLEVIEATPKKLIEVLTQAVYYSEGLGVNGHFSAKYLLNQAVNNAGIKGILSGEGSDEVFLGYPHFREDLCSLDLFNQQVASEKAYGNLYQTNTVSVGIQLAHGAQLDLQSVQDALGHVPAFLKAKASLGAKLQPILAQDYLEQALKNDYYQGLMDSFPVSTQLKKRHPVYQASYLWSKMTLANYILKTLGDGCEMAHSVEGRLPFLDHHLFAFLKTVPLSLKIKSLACLKDPINPKDSTSQWIEKYILKEAVKPFISERIYHRQKHPFTAPPLSLSTQGGMSVSQLLRDLVGPDSAQSTGILPFIDPQQLRKLLQQFPTMSVEEQLAYDPVFMFLLTAVYLHREFKLGLVA